LDKPKQRNKVGLRPFACETGGFPLISPFMGVLLPSKPTNASGEEGILKQLGVNHYRHNGDKTLK
jgi:hypothetical protein